ncbi:MAG: hypothetical protein FJ137_15435 [Deltaproteobacteria bacterium]|nr:hypothetical protein [Deltaproteobacteria bacterium]
MASTSMRRAGCSAPRSSSRRGRRCRSYRADRPTGDRPAGDRPAGDRPAGDRPGAIVAGGGEVARRRRVRLASTGRGRRLRRRGCPWYRSERTRSERCRRGGEGARRRRQVHAAASSGARRHGRGVPRQAGQ